jgi:sigma-B regulation protein RsbU (phosphoserine phosphatase)
VEELLVATDHVLQSPPDDVHLITLLLARLAPDTGEFVYASAGHEPGLILDRRGEVRMQLDSTAFPLGCQLNSPDHQYVEVRLVPGDTVVLLTDGIREATTQHRSVFGRERVVEIVRAHLREPARRIAEALADAVWQHCHPHSPADDLTAIVIKVSPDVGSAPAPAGH